MIAGLNEFQQLIVKDKEGEVIVYLDDDTLIYADGIEVEFLNQDYHPSCH